MPPFDLQHVNLLVIMRSIILHLSQKMSGAAAVVTVAKLQIFGSFLTVSPLDLFFSNFVPDSKRYEHALKKLLPMVIVFSTMGELFNFKKFHSG